MRGIAVTLIVLASTGAGAQVSETIARLPDSKCVYSGSVSGELRKSSYGSSPLSGRVEIVTSTQTVGSERKIQFNMNATIDADDLNAKILMKVAEGGAYDTSKGHLAKLSVLYDLSAKKFMFTKTLQHDEYEAQLEQSLNQTTIVTRGNNANGKTVVPLSGIVSSTFPVFQMSKVVRDSMHSIPVLKFLRLNGSIKPIVAEQDVSVTNIQAPNADAQMTAPLAIYGMVSNGPVKVLIDQRTQMIKQVYMRIGNENKESEPLDFEITSNLGAGNCK